MYIHKTQAQTLSKELTCTMSDELKEKSDFMIALANDDAWSLIIKSHALIESLVTELVLAKIGKDNLRGVIERLPLSDEQIGKLRIAKDYGVLSSAERKFIKKLSSLRNNLVHKVENIDFDLDEYVSTFDKGQKKSWQAAFTWFEEGEEVKDSWADAALYNPRKTVWLAIFMFVTHTAVKIAEIKGISELKLASEKTMTELVSDSL